MGARVQSFVNIILKILCGIVFCLSVYFLYLVSTIEWVYPLLNIITIFLLGFIAIFSLIALIT
ncbi:MAG: hypothetical protein QW118_06840 [Nitrososphaerota archaeon]